VNHIRHSGIFDASNLSVTLVGAGGIGAMTALMLVKMGVELLTIYDGDTVSEENLPTQLHRLGTEGELKVAALKATLELFGDDTQIFAEPARIGAGDAVWGSIVISAVDSIQARKDIWQAVRNGKAGWYIDARMSAEEFQMHAIDMSSPKAVERYGRMIAAEDDGGIPDAPCTQKATFFCSAIASGHIGSVVRKIAAGRRPAAYLVHNILYDRLFHLGDA
jgi:molybdopterin/thiamine biosynthesis adenylyltransferase